MTREQLKRAIQRKLHNWLDHNAWGIVALIAVLVCVFIALLNY